MQLINGGVFFLRPCPAAGVHMLSMLATRPKLRFQYGTAEQDFFAWYYKYTGASGRRWPLPLGCEGSLAAAAAASRE